MATTLKQLVAPQYLTATPDVFYTTSTGVVTLLRRLTFHNSDVDTQTVSIWIVPSSGTADDSNLILDAKAVGADQTYTFPDIESHVMKSGDTFVVQASAATSIMMILSGTEIS